MKKIISLLIFLPLLALSCKYETKDLFDKSAADRINDAVDEYLDVLTLPENGWRLDYYPAKTRAYGGFNMFFKFDRDGSVTVSSEAGNPDQTETSLYEIITSQGPVISFNTYNSLIHIFSNPGITGGAGAGTGYGGDYEFAIMSATSREVTLKGVKTGNVMRMTPVGQEETWEEYLTGVEELQDELAEEFYSLYNVMVDGERVFQLVAGNYSVFTYVAPGETNVYNTSTMAYIYTPEGIRFYEPLVFKPDQEKNLSVQMQEFVWDADQAAYVSVDNPTIMLVGGYPDDYIYYEEWLGNYKFYAKVGRATVYTEYDVTLTELSFGSTYTCSGIVWPFIMTFDKATSRLMFNTGQTVRESVLHNGAYWPVILYASPNPGNLYTSSATGLVSRQDEENKNLFFWDDNGAAASTGFGYYITHSGGYTSYSDTTFYECYMIKQ